jgi:hypothetical protein
MTCNEVFLRAPARSRAATAAMAVVAALLAGCGGGEKKEGLVEANGTVLLDGRPLIGAQVTFDHPMHPETFGRTDSRGYYEMSYTATQEGAFVGENVVSFTTADAELGEPELIPKTYRFGKSKLTINVTEEGGPYDFDLTSDEGDTTSDKKEGAAVSSR